MSSHSMAPGDPHNSRSSARTERTEVMGFHGSLAHQQLPYSAADRGRSRQRSGPPVLTADSTGGAYSGGAAAYAANSTPAMPDFSGSTRVLRSASAPPSRMEAGPDGSPTDPMLARLQRTEKQLQRQRAEQAQWAAAAQQLLRVQGSQPLATSPPEAQRRRRAELPPLHSQPGQPRQPASLDLKPNSDLCRAFASLQAGLKVVEQQPHGWEARRAAHQAALARDQEQWETRRAAEQWSWQMRRQAEEQAWRQARQQQQEAWLEKRRLEEQEWFNKRRREEQEQAEKCQRAEQQWQLEQRQALQLQQQVEPRPTLPPRELYSQPPHATLPFMPPAPYNYGGDGSGTLDSSSGLPLPPLPAEIEGDSMQLDLLTFDSFDFMEMARDLGLTSPTHSQQLLPTDILQGPLGPLGNPATAQQPFSQLPVQEAMGNAAGQWQAGGVVLQAQRAQHTSTSPPASC